MGRTVIETCDICEHRIGDGEPYVAVSLERGSCDEKGCEVADAYVHDGLLCGECSERSQLRVSELLARFAWKKARRRPYVRENPRAEESGDSGGGAL